VAREDDSVWGGLYMHNDQFAARCTPGDVAKFRGKEGGLATCNHRLSHLCPVYGRCLMMQATLLYRKGTPLSILRVPPSSMGVRATGLVICYLCTHMSSIRNYSISRLIGQKLMI
jgi:hypothetical protein